MDKPQITHSIGQRVAVHVTRDVAYDLGKLNKVTASVLGKLGCPNCHSGHIIDFRMLEDFVVNPKTLEVEEVVFGRG